MSLGIKTLVAIGGLGGGVLVPWSLNKLRSNSSNLVSPQVSSDVTVPPEKSEESPSESAQIPEEAPPSPSQHSEEEPSAKTLETPAQAPNSPPEVTVKEGEETGNCTALETMPDDIDTWFWTTGADSGEYVTVTCENVEDNPLITKNNWGGLFPERFFATLRSSLTKKKFDIKMEVTPTESGLSSYTVVFNGGNKFNSLVNGKWTGETENTDEKTLKVISITAPPASSTEKIYIWSN